MLTGSRRSVEGKAQATRAIGISQNSASANRGSGETTNQTSSVGTVTTSTESSGVKRARRPRMSAADRHERAGIRQTSSVTAGTTSKDLISARNHVGNQCEKLPTWFGASAGYPGPRRHQVGHCVDGRGRHAPVDREAEDRQRKQWIPRQDGLPAHPPEPEQDWNAGHEHQRPADSPPVGVAAPPRREHEHAHREYGRYPLQRACRAGQREGGGRGESCRGTKPGLDAFGQIEGADGHEHVGRKVEVGAREPIPGADPDHRHGRGHEQERHAARERRWPADDADEGQTARRCRRTASTRATRSPGGSRPATTGRAAGRRRAGGAHLRPRAGRGGSRGPGSRDTSTRTRSRSGDRARGRSRRHPRVHDSRATASPRRRAQSSTTRSAPREDREAPRRRPPRRRHPRRRGAIHANQLMLRKRLQIWRYASSIASPSHRSAAARPSAREPESTRRTAPPRQEPAAGEQDGDHEPRCRRPRASGPGHAGRSLAAPDHRFTRYPSTMAEDRSGAVGRST